MGRTERARRSFDNDLPSRTDSRCSCIPVTPRARHLGAPPRSRAAWIIRCCGRCHRGERESGPRRLESSFFSCILPDVLLRLPISVGDLSLEDLKTVALELDKTCARHAFGVAGAWEIYLHQDVPTRRPPRQK